MARELQDQATGLKTQNEELLRTLQEYHRAKEELQEREALLRAVFDNAPFEFWVRDRKGRLVLQNPRAVEHWGDQLGKTPREAGASPQDLAIWQRNNRRALAGEIVQGEVEFRTRDKKGWFYNLVGPFRVDGKIRGIFGFNINITARKQAEQQLQALSGKRVASHENERRRIARELHDQIGQSLTAIQINLQTAQITSEPADLQKRLSESLQLVEELVQQTQDLSLRLRPLLLDDLGLEAALRWLINRQIAHTHLRATIRLDSLHRRLDTAIETACFRVAQEALTNVLRHARASTVTIRLSRRKSCLQLIVRDNGRGFKHAEARRNQTSPNGLGFLGMQERTSLVGGQLEICSEVNRGTTVRAQFPLKWQASTATSLKSKLPAA